jgi:hypothetical protein
MSKRECRALPARSQWLSFLPLRKPTWPLRRQHPLRQRTNRRDRDGADGGSELARLSSGNNHRRRTHAPTTQARTPAQPAWVRPCALAARYGLKAARLAGGATSQDAVGTPRHFTSRIMTYQGFTAPFSSELPDARNLNYEQITYIICLLLIDGKQTHAIFPGLTKLS